MSTVKESLDRILDLSGDLVETQKDLLIIKLVENSTKAASASILGSFGLSLTVIVLIFLGLGCSWWIGESLDNIKLGFFIVGGIYALLLTIMLMSGKTVIIPAIRNLLIRKLYED
jgi:hypothetical protein